MPGRTFNAKDYVNAWNTHNADKVAEHYAEDAQVHAPEGGSRGRSEVKASVQGWMRAFPDVNGDIETFAQGDEEVALLVHFSGKHTGPLELVEGQPIQATNRTITLPVAMFMKLDAEGKIREERDVYDMTEFFRQLSIPTDMVSRILTKASPSGRSG